MEPLIIQNPATPLSIRNFSFSGLFGQTQSSEMELKLKNSVFQDLSMRDIRLLRKTANAGTRNFSDKLMVAGEENETLYLLTKGSCLIKNGGKFFAEVGAGHFLGEISYFDHQPVSADVVSRGNVEFLSWNRTSLNRLFAKRPGLQSRFYNVLIRHIANRLQSSTEKIIPMYAS